MGKQLDLPVPKELLNYTIVVKSHILGLRPIYL